ncbi:tail fiber assembly protein [Aeromonas phage Gekk3-15]
MFKFKNGSFYPYSLKQEYEKTGTWPADGADIDVGTFQHYTGIAPEGFELGADSEGLPCWVKCRLPSQSEVDEMRREVIKGEIGKVDAISPVHWASLSNGEKDSMVNYRCELVRLANLASPPDGAFLPPPPIISGVVI